jgi:membrane protease YdiL (CAAX protease family)
MAEAKSGTSHSTKHTLVIAVILLLWVGYTVLQTSAVIGHISEGWSAALGFLPGVLGVAVLLSAGMKCEDCYLVAKPISLPGVAVLAGVFVFALSTMLPAMVWRGWSWRAALILAPAGGVAQELFFRCSLLPAFERLLGNRHRLALVIHAILFGLWHIGPLFVGAPVWAVIAVMLVPLLSGIGWGWQVMRDRTVLWAMIQHSLIWMVGLQFDVPG